MKKDCLQNGVIDAGYEAVGTPTSDLLTAAFPEGISPTADRRELTIV